MLESLNIDGISYDRQGLDTKWTDVLADDQVHESQVETWQFIKNWFDDRDHIEVMTSGSTGSPSAIRIPKQWMKASAHATAKAIDLQAGQSAFLCISARHIGGMMMIVRAIELGMKLFTSIPSRRPDPSRSMDFTAMVPMQVKTLLRAGNDLSEFGTIIIGGAPMDAWTERHLLNAKTSVYATFGMTETVSHFALRKLNAGNISDEFTTLPGVTVSNDEDDRLTVKIPYMDDLTAHSKDLVEIKDENSFIWKGRLDNIINSGGLKLNPESIEKEMAKYLSGSFFIHKEPNSLYGEAVVLCLEGEDANIREIEKAIETITDSKSRPKVVYSIKNFIRTETGKLLRKQTFAQEKRRLF